MRYSSFMLTILAAALISGCGVETGGEADDGSGNDLTQTFNGRFVDGNDQALSGVRLTLDISGAECVSDESGECTFETEAVSGDIDLLIDGSDQSSSLLRINAVPAEARIIDFQAILEAGRADLAALAFDGSDVPLGSETPGPSNTPSSAATPTPTRRPGNAATPTPVPTPDPVARGRKVYQKTCGQCHSSGKGDGLNADELSGVLDLSQHQGVRLSSSQLSDLVAFLNR